GAGAGGGGGGLCAGHGAGGMSAATGGRRGTAQLYAAIAVGSAIGSVLRWGASIGMHATFGDGLPWGTLFVNVAGSFAIGFYAALTGPDGRLFAGARTRQFVMTGVCGGFTTFSLFSFETLLLVQTGAAALTALYIGVSLVTWF